MRKSEPPVFGHHLSLTFVPSALSSRMLSFSSVWLFSPVSSVVSYGFLWSHTGHGSARIAECEGMESQLEMEE